MVTDVADVERRPALADDPRLDGEFWHGLPRTDVAEPAIIVGVVHNHPASSYRVRTVGNALDPDALALELPERVVPTFRNAAVDDSAAAHPPDEMCAALSAFPETDAVGIDSFDTGFLRRFASTALSHRATPGTLYRTASTIRRSVGEAETVTSEGELTALGGAVDHVVTAGSPPAVQARDETSNVDRNWSMLGAVERPPGVKLLDETRERNMAANRASLREDRSVLAVVGMAHLEAFARIFD